MGVTDRNAIRAPGDGEQDSKGSSIAHCCGLSWKRQWPQWVESGQGDSEAGALNCTVMSWIDETDTPDRVFAGDQSFNAMTCSQASLLSFGS